MFRSPPYIRCCAGWSGRGTYNQAYQGRNRRYYSITPSGRQRCQEYRREWQAYKRQLDQVILGGNHNG